MRPPKRQRCSTSSYVYGTANWSLRERQQLLLVLKWHDQTDIESIAQRIPTKTKNEIEWFMKQIRISKMKENEPICIQAAIEAWLDLALDIVAYEVNDASDLLSKVMAIAANYEEHPDPKPGVTPDYKAIYNYLAALLDGECFVPTLPPLESAIVLDLVHGLVDTLASVCTKKQSVVMQWKYRGFQDKPNINRRGITRFTHRVIHNDFSDLGISELMGEDRKNEVSESMIPGLPIDSTNIQIPETRVTGKGDNSLSAGFVQNNFTCSIYSGSEVSTPNVFMSNSLAPVPDSEMKIASTEDKSAKTLQVNISCTSTNDSLLTTENMIQELHMQSVPASEEAQLASEVKLTARTEIAVAEVIIPEASAISKGDKSNLIKIKMSRDDENCNTSISGGNFSQITESSASSKTVNSTSGPSNVIDEAGGCNASGSSDLLQVSEEVPSNSAIVESQGKHITSMEGTLTPVTLVELESLDSSSHSQTEVYMAKELGYLTQAEINSRKDGSVLPVIGNTKSTDMYNASTSTGKFLQVIEVSYDVSRICQISETHVTDEEKFKQENLISTTGDSMDSRTDIMPKVSTSRKRLRNSRFVRRDKNIPDTTASSVGDQQSLSCKNPKPLFLTLNPFCIPEVVLNLKRKRPYESL